MDGPYQLWVIVVEADRLQLGRNAVNLCEELSAALIGAAVELVADGQLPERRCAGFDLHLAEEAQVSEEDQQGQQDEHRQDDTGHNHTAHLHGWQLFKIQLRPVIRNIAVKLHQLQYGLTLKETETENPYTQTFNPRPSGPSTKVRSSVGVGGMWEGR